MSTRILIIEDNATNLELMTYLLQAFGYAVLVARSGADGLSLAAQEQPDLILCDIGMRGVDGYEVVRRLKDDPVRKTIPLVAVTAYAMVGDRDKILAAGFDGYISKPIDAERFTQQVGAYLPADRQAGDSVPIGQGRHAPAQAAESTASPNRRATILVLDNTEANISLACNILQPHGYTVTTARTVKEALSLARRQPPDLFLSDVHMPCEDGYDFIRAVKKDPVLHGIPFVFLSSTASRGKVQQDLLALGASRFLVRPIEPQALLAVVEACLAEGKA
jgi:two-component system cell cycle response regulator